MSLTNIQRDTFWIYPSEQRNLQWSGIQSIHNNLPVCNCAGGVNIDVGMAHARQNISLKLGQMVCIGTLMIQVPKDNSPYRVKARTPGEAGIIVGYLREQYKSENNVIHDPLMITFNDFYDDILMLPDDIPNRSYPVIFALANMDRVSKNKVGTISVQNLGLKPPTMQKAVS